MEKAYLIRKENFEFKEASFVGLKCITNNIILKYVYGDNTYFKRSLRELDRLGFSIGILATISDNVNSKEYLKDLLSNIRGYKIDLGVWVETRYIEDYNKLYGPLEEKFSSNFITGVKDTHAEYLDLNMPKWGYLGDIEDDGVDKLNFIDNDIIKLKLNTDYKTIYNENNLQPIPSTLDIESKL